jgi:hypothetical protein
MSVSEPRFSNEWSSVAVQLRWVFAVIAVLVGLMVMLWPSTESEGFGWGYDGDVGSGESAISAEFDTVTGAVSSNRDSEVLSFPAGVAFSMSGINGDGWLHVEATDPGGEVVVRRDIPPHAAFWIPNDAADAGALPDDAALVDVILEIDPVDVVHPDDVARGRLTVVNNSLEEPATIVLFGVEGWIADAPAMLVSGELDSCDSVAAQLPLILAPLTAATCTFDIPGSPALGPEFSGVVTVAGQPDVISSEPLLLAFTEMAPQQRTSYPEPPPGLNPSDTLETQIDAEVRTGDAGTYVVTLTSPMGSRSVFFNISGRDTTLVLPITEHPMSWIGLVWLATGLALGMTGLGRVSGSFLLGSGAIIPLVLLSTGEHLWYWVVPTGALAVAAIAAAGTGAALIMPTARTSRRRSVAAAFIVPGIVFAVAAAGTSAAYDPMNPPYHGDYIIKGLHILLMSAGVATAAIGGALIGHPTETTRADSSEVNPRQPVGHIRQRKPVAPG